MKMKKVVFVFDRVAHYHRELFICLERQLADMGIELYLLSGTAPAGAVGRSGLKEMIVKNERKYFFREYKLGSYVVRRHVGVAEAIRDICPDVVVLLSHVGNMSHWALFGLKARMGFKLVAWQCGYEYNAGFLKNIVLRAFVPRFDHHLAYHSNAATYALSHGAAPGQVTVIHNTINEQAIASISKVEARAFVRGVHPLIGDRRIILFVGAVLVEKRIEDIIDALDIIGRNDLVFVLVGDGDHLPAIREKCSGRSDVVFAGAVVAGVGPYFDAAEVYLLPGTGGLGINEAMAHSLPIISGYADGSADDLVVDGFNGFRLRGGGATELAGKISSVLDDSSLCASMGANSRKLITGDLSFARFLGRVTDSLGRLVL